MIEQPILFFQFRIHYIKYLTQILRNTQKTFFVQISTSFKLIDSIPRNKFIQIYDPDIVEPRPRKKRQPILIDLKTLLIVVMVFK